MKNLITPFSIAAVLSVCTLTHAQTQDSALARVDNTKKTDELPTTKPAANNAEQVNVEPQSKFVLPKANEKSSKENFNNKVGPQGEEVFMERKKYYYINSDGKKVEVKQAELRDKPKHS